MDVQIVYKGIKINLFTLNHRDNFKTIIFRKTSPYNPKDFGSLS
jgi:hypothetical protein